jgi:hypothetical protein
MLLFIVGLFLGGSLGVFLIAMLVKFREADEAVGRFVEEKDRVAQECVPVTQQSIV